MLIVLFILITILAIYLACFRPPWFWALYVCCYSFFDLVGGFIHVHAAGIPVGPLQVRGYDPATIGLLVGTLYHARRRGLRGFKEEPTGYIFAGIMLLLLVKLVFAMTLGLSTIEANRTASHVGFGLVAAVGDVRDAMMAFITPIYVFVTLRYCRLRMLAWPIVVSTSFILFKGLVHIAISGHIWTDDASDRFIISTEAITLTILSLMLLFLRVPRMPRSMSRGLAVFAFIVALVANHRTQWLAAAGALFVMILITFLGKPLFRNMKLARLGFMSVALGMVTLGVLLLAASTDLAERYPVLEAIKVRLYAVTDPGRDADASWREALWRDRIDQVGNDWPWGRTLGDRRESLYNDTWLSVPDHSAYVSTYEMGGVIFAVLVLAFWGTILRIAAIRLVNRSSYEELWPAVVATTITVACLGFGTGYDFPLIGPAFALILVLR